MTVLHKAPLPPCFVFTDKETLALHPDMQPPLFILTKCTVIALLSAAENKPTPNLGC